MSEILVLKSKLISFTDMILKVKVRNYLTWLLLYNYVLNDFPKNGLYSKEAGCKHSAAF